MIAASRIRAPPDTRNSRAIAASGALSPNTVSGRPPPAARAKGMRFRAWRCIVLDSIGAASMRMTRAHRSLPRGGTARSQLDARFTSAGRRERLAGFVYVACLFICFPLCMRASRHFTACTLVDSTEQAAALVVLSGEVIVQMNEPCRRSQRKQQRLETACTLNRHLPNNVTAAMNYLQTVAAEGASHSARTPRRPDELPPRACSCRAAIGADVRSMISSLVHDVARPFPARSLLIGRLGPWQGTSRLWLA